MTYGKKNKTIEKEYIMKQMKKTIQENTKMISY